jgi:transcriptional regulator with XRE-family HTH domain
MAIDESLSERVADEIRAMLGRKRTSGRELARKLGVSQAWVSYRLTGHQEIGLNDLERIAAALDVEVADLLPATQPATRRTRLTGSYPIAAHQATPDHPTGHLVRPSTRPTHSARHPTRTPEGTAGNPRPARLSHPPAPHPPATGQAIT